MKIESKILAVGFADLERYHKYVIKYGGKAAIDLLNETYNLAGDIIVKNGGKIIKYMGDSIMFILEDPSKSEITAKKITECFKKDFNDHTVQFNVSIATGEVFLTKIGHKSFKMNDIFGETVNRAALLNREISGSQSKYLLCEETKKYINKSEKYI